MRRFALAAAVIACSTLAGCATAPPFDTVAEGALSLPERRAIRPFDVLRADGTPFEHPFLGGFNVPRPQFVDIDADGDADLFLQEYTGSIMFFENRGAGKFVWRTDSYRDIDVGEWNRFADVDRDGDFDLLTERPYSYISYYQNVGTASEAVFKLAADTLRDVSGMPIFSDRQNIPNVTDIDCDELSDLFIGRLDGTITRYEAVARSDVPEFELVTERFESIEIVAQFAQPGNIDPRPAPNIPSGDRPENGPSAPGDRTAGSMRHGANTMIFGDLDGDNDMDLFWGDFFEPSVLKIENTGSCITPVLRGEPKPFPPPDPVITSGYNAPAFADVDEDGDMDLFVGVLGGAFNPNRTAHANFYFYEQRDNRSFHLRTRHYLDQIDVGGESFPTLADLDADGDPDLLLANKISSENSRTSVLVRFENVDGTLQIRDSLSLHPSYHYAPALADIDGDEDLDMLLGTWNDGIALYRNVGSPIRPDLELEERGYIVLTRGSHSTPALVDIDADGDLDVFVGETSGTINFYRNDGTPEKPDFVLVADEYEGIEIDRRSVPVFRDVDGDDDQDLIVGSESDGLMFFRNTGSPTQPEFRGDGRLPHDVPLLATPAFGDLDGDGDDELLVGGLGGGLIFFDQ